MAIPGTIQITGLFAPTSSGDTYAITDTQYGKDGLRNIELLSALNSIPEDRRKAGMIVGVSGGTKYYALNNEPWGYDLNDWRELTGLASGITVSGVYTTGGTYSNSVLTLNDSTGGTLNITGLTQEKAIVYVDPINGNDNLAQGSDTPVFQTPISAVTYATSGTVIEFLPGDYYYTDDNENWAKVGVEYYFHSNANIYIQVEGGKPFNFDFGTATTRNITIKGNMNIYASPESFSGTSGTWYPLKFKGASGYEPNVHLEFNELYVKWGAINMDDYVKTSYIKGNIISDNVDNFAIYYTPEIVTNSNHVFDVGKIVVGPECSWGGTAGIGIYRLPNSLTDTVTINGKIGYLEVNNTSGVLNAGISSNYSSTTPYDWLNSVVDIEVNHLRINSTNNNCYGLYFIRIDNQLNIKVNKTRIVDYGRILSIADDAYHEANGDLIFNDIYSTTNTTPFAITSASLGNITLELNGICNPSGSTDILYMGGGSPNFKVGGNIINYNGNGINLNTPSKVDIDKIVLEVEGDYSIYSSYISGTPVCYLSTAKLNKPTSGITVHSACTTTMAPLSVSGSVTANSFIGDGSQLTGLGAAVGGIYWTSGSTGTDSIKVNNGTTNATGDYAVAEGSYTTATGDSSHVEGSYSKAYGTYSHAEGIYTTASGNNGAHSEGSNSTAQGQASHAEGYYGKALGQYSHAEGQSTTANADSSHAEGASTSAYGFYSHAEGFSTKAIGNHSHAEGFDGEAYGSGSHTEGSSTVASGDSSHAEGNGTLASGSSSHAEGLNTTAQGNQSHSEGYGTSAVGEASHSEGYETTAIGLYSHAEGRDTTASGNYSHSEGNQTIASGQWSRAGGYYTHAQGDYSFVDGLGLSSRILYASGKTAFNFSENTGSQIAGRGANAANSVILGGINHHIEESSNKSGIFCGDGSVIYSGGVESFIGGGDGHQIYSGDGNTIIGGKDCQIGDATGYTLYSAIIAGNNNTILPGVDNTVILGCSNITATESNTVYTCNVNIGGTLTVNGVEIPTQTEPYWTSGSSGDYSIKALNDTSLSATANYAIAIGSGTHAGGSQSFAEGLNTLASGISSHAEGQQTTALGDRSHSEGYLSLAIGPNSHAEGLQNIASGDSSHAEGNETTAIGPKSHAEGGRTQAVGQYAHAEGLYTKVFGQAAHAEGQYTTATGVFSHAEGSYTTALGTASHAEGSGTTASGNYSHSEGADTTAGGQYSHAGGLLTQALANNSFTHGENNIILSAATNSSILGGSNITGSSSDTLYISNLNINSGTTANTVPNVLVRSNDGTVSTRDINTLTQKKAIVYVDPINGNDDIALSANTPVFKTPISAVTFAEVGSVIEFLPGEHDYVGGNWAKSGLTYHFHQGADIIYKVSSGAVLGFGPWIVGDTSTEWRVTGHLKLYCDGTNGSEVFSDDYPIFFGGFPDTEPSSVHFEFDSIYTNEGGVKIEDYITYSNVKGNIIKGSTDYYAFSLEPKLGGTHTFEINHIELGKENRWAGTAGIGIRGFHSYGVGVYSGATTVIGKVGYINVPNNTSLINAGIAFDYNNQTNFYADNSVIDIEVGNLNVSGVTANKAYGLYPALYGGISQSYRGTFNLHVKKSLLEGYGSLGYIKNRANNNIIFEDVTSRSEGIPLIVSPYTIGETNLDVYGVHSGVTTNPFIQVTTGEEGNGKLKIGGNITNNNGGGVQYTNVLGDASFDKVIINTNTGNTIYSTSPSGQTICYLSTAKLNNPTSGITVSSACTITTPNISVSGSVTATAYYGDGSNLSGILVSDDYVNTSGDTMTGDLIVSATSSANIFKSNTKDILFGDNIATDSIQLSADTEQNIFIGDEVGRYYTTTVDFGGNAVVGYQAYISGGTDTSMYSTSYGNTIFGNKAGKVATLFNTYIGYNTGELCAGRRNTFIGAGAGELASGASICDFIGTDAGKYAKGEYQIAIGRSTADNSVGDYNTALQREAGRNNIGDYNAFIGHECGYNNNGSYSILMGNQAGYNNTGSYSILLGNQVGYNNSTDHRLMIDSGNTDNPLLDGSFSARTLDINGDLTTNGDISVTGASNVGVNNTNSGTHSYTQGSGNTASGLYSGAKGALNNVTGDFSYAEGSGNTVAGDYAHAEGWNTQAGSYSHAEGKNCTSSQQGHAEGQNTWATGGESHAEGLNTTATGSNGAHAEGSYTSAGGLRSHSEGYGTSAIGDSSHAEGYSTTATGGYSHSEGRNTTAIAISSHAGGEDTEAGGNYSFVHSKTSNINTGSASSAILGGSGHTINDNIINSVILGGQNITASSADTVYTPYLNATLSGGTPTTSGDTGEIGAIRWDEDYIYLRTGKNGGAWGRIALDYDF
jgi:hypothetical protein